MASSLACEDTECGETQSLARSVSRGSAAVLCLRVSREFVFSFLFLSCFSHAHCSVGVNTFCHLCIVACKRRSFASTFFFFSPPAAAAAAHQDQLKA